jgi:hypothetical protein
MRKYAARLLAGDTKLHVLIPAQLVPGHVFVTIDDVPTNDFSIVGSTIVLSSPLGEGGATVEVAYPEA